MLRKPGKAQAVWASLARVRHIPLILLFVHLFTCMQNCSIACSFVPSFICLFFNSTVIYLFVSTKVSLIQSTEEEALPPPELQSRIKDILKASPDIAETVSLNK